MQGGIIGPRGEVRLRVVRGRRLSIWRRLWRALKGDL